MVAGRISENKERYVNWSKYLSTKSCPIRGLYSKLQCLSSIQVCVILFMLEMQHILLSSKPSKPSKSVFTKRIRQLDGNTMDCYAIYCWNGDPQRHKMDGFECVTSQFVEESQGFQTYLSEGWDMTPFQQNYQWIIWIVCFIDNRMTYNNMDKSRLWWAIHLFLTHLSRPSENKIPCCFHSMFLYSIWAVWLAWARYTHYRWTILVKTHTRCSKYNG